MKTLLLNVEDEKVEVIEIEDRLEAFYDKIGCDFIEIAERRIGGRRFDVMCDEEGTFKAEPKISAVDNFGQPMFVGNLLFFHHDGEGELVGLTDDDIKLLKRKILMMGTIKFPAVYPMLTGCEY